MSKAKVFTRINARGDTIVEVLIVLAVLGFAFTIAAATSSRGLTQSRNAEEHSQALGILNSQMELARQAVANQVSLPTDPHTSFCMVGGNYDTNLTHCQQNASGGYTYSPMIAYYPSDPTDPTSAGFYQFKVNWEGPSGIGSQQEVMNYRTHDLTPTSNPNILLSATAPQIKVSVKKIPPVNGGNQTYDTTPSCTNAATENIGGSQVQLQATDGSTSGSGTTSDSDSAVIFQQPTVVDFGQYRATVSGVLSGYLLCGAPTSSSYTATPGTVTAINFAIRPNCDNPRPQTYMSTFADPAGTNGPGYYADGGTGGPGWYSDGPYQHPYEHYRTISWYQHTGVDKRHSGWTTDKHIQEPSSQPGYGGVLTDAWYKIRTDLSYSSSSGWFFERWEQWYGQQDLGYYADGGTGGPGWYQDGPYQHPYEHAYAHTLTRTIYVCPS